MKKQRLFIETYSSVVKNLISFVKEIWIKLLSKDKFFLSIRTSLYFMLIMFLAGCSNKEGGSIPFIDLTEKYELKKIDLQDIAQVKYLSLETDTLCLLRGRSPKCISKDYIIYTNNDLGSILLFDHFGKIVHIINRQGPGPEEYKSIGSIAFDENTKELYCFLLYDRIIKVYGLDGTYIKTLPIPEGQFLDTMYDYNDSLLVSWYDGVKRSSTYCFQSKKDSIQFQTILTIPHEKKISPNIYKSIPHGTLVVGAPIQPFVFQNGRYLIADPSNDTIFRITEKRTLEPVFRRIPSIRTQDPKVALDYGLESKDYIFMTAVELEYDFDTKEGLTQTPYLLEKKSGKIYRTQVTNRDYPNDPEYFYTAYHLVSGRLVHYLSADELLEALESNQLSGELKEIASTLNEEDNGVLMMVDFK